MNFQEAREIPSNIRLLLSIIGSQSIDPASGLREYSDTSLHLQSDEDSSLVRASLMIDDEEWAPVLDIDEDGTVHQLLTAVPLQNGTAWTDQIKALLEFIGTAESLGVDVYEIAQSNPLRRLFGGDPLQIIHFLEAMAAVQVDPARRLLKGVEKILSLSPHQIAMLRGFITTNHD
ncbi:MAG TPA: hypothetical protein V6D29_04000 [Leptolyngbyaceae cyanobacterium]